MDVLTPSITQSELFELFFYNQSTGEFTWKISLSPRAQVGVLAGCRNAMGYWVMRIKGRLYYRHRLVWLWENGIMVDEIDHRDKTPGNDWITNLRVATHSQNQMNRKVQSNNTSGHPGVTWSNRHQKWLVQIKKQGRSVYGGRFIDKSDAISRAKELRDQLHANFAFDHSHE